MKLLKMIGYGIVIWAIPYVTAIFLLGLMTSDPFFFKTIMIVEGALVGAICIISYFSGVRQDFLKESIMLGIVWMVVNWLLDFAGVLTFSKMPFDRYFMEIGLRYLVMPAMTISVGYLLDKKIKS